ncbi:MAG TPA: hypothetical protein VM052_07610 [Candidatus Limnocylindrales bacterium]|nr:hypothetical protein [Candidatus Limnocylindrales bacterium]
MAISARDKKSVLAMVEQAQLLYLLTRYPKKQVMDDAGDVDRLEKGLAQMRSTAAELSAALRRDHAAIAWDELAQEPDTKDLAWRRAKRLAPTVLRELIPLLEGQPEAAFFLRPEAPKRAASATRTPAATRKKTASTSGARRPR